jgi:hypothetical protein
MLYDLTLYPIESVLESMLIIFIGLTGSMFWSIVMLALSVRLLTKPLEKITKAAVKSQTQFEGVLRPQLAAIKHKYSGSQQHDAITRLYQRYSYHPIFAVRSLLGLLVQLPFFISAYFMLSSFTDMSGVVIPMLGDLGVPDTLLFGRFHLLPFVMTLVNIAALSTIDNPDRKSFAQGIAISFVFLVLLYESPLGLIVYWTTNNLFSLISNIIRRLAKRTPVKISLPSFKGSGAARFFEDYAYIFFVVNLAVLVPLLGVLGDQFNLFTAHSMTGAAIVSLLFFLMLLPATVVSFLRWLAKLSGVVKAFDAVILTIFLGVFFAYIFNKTGYGVFSSVYEPAILFCIALVVTVGSVIIILNSESLKKLSYLSLLIPLIVLHFIFVSPASTLFEGTGGMPGIEPEGIRDTPVFLLVFDEFSGLTLQNPEGSLDVSRYPGFAEIARNADYFPNALTTGYHTDISVPSIVSGTLRSGENKGLAPGENLIELFQDWGGGVSAQSVVLPADLVDKQQTNFYSLASDIATLYLHIVSHQNWIENKIGVIPATWKDFGVFYKMGDVAESSAEQVSKQAGIFFDWLEPLAVNTGDKQFNFLHIVFPHVPYTTTATGKSQENSDLIRQQLTSVEKFDAGQSFLNVGYHNYLQQSSYAELLLHRLVLSLKKTGMYDKSLIIVTADHGVSYSAKGLSRRDPKTKDSWKNIVSVPLIVKHPFQEVGKVNETFVTTLDITPTIMDVIEIDPPWDLAGESLNALDAKTQTSSVELIPGYDDYFGDVVVLFQESRSRKETLFGVGSPVTDVAVNYTEDSMYSSLLNAELSESLVSGASELNAIWGGSMRPSELSHFGIIYHYSEPVNDKVIAAVVNNRIRAIFLSGNVKGQSGKFAFSLPEDEAVPLEFSVTLYEVENGEKPSLKKLRTSSSNQFAFETKKIIKYDWKNSVVDTNGVDSLIIDDENISVIASISNDPFIVMQAISDEPIPNPSIRIEINSNRELLVQLFYQTPDDPFFAETRSQAFRINEGSSSVYFNISDAVVGGNFRLDFGLGGFTEVQIEDIQVRY